MKLCVISDTHMPKKAKQLPKILIEHLKTVDYIINAGDWQTIDVYLELVKYAPIEGVYGNVDGDDIQAKFSFKKVLDMNGFKVGIVHGHGKGQTTEKRALAAFENEKVDMIIFGHSHIPINKKVGDILVFNPGSPTDKRRQLEFSFGIVHINEQIKAEHVFFSDKTD